MREIREDNIGYRRHKRNEDKTSWIIESRQKMR
jgi:hypothetical protein